MGVDLNPNPILMNNHPAGKYTSANTAEKRSVKILMDKMGMSKKEVEQVSKNYGVTASKLVELMQLSKYQFVYTEESPGQCRPCTRLEKIEVVRADLYDSL
jgi:hypothetical protein